MLKEVEIRLTEPICKCETQDLAWGISDGEDGHGLFIRCNTCKTELRIPYKAFKAYFNLDKKYPREKSKEPEKPKLEVLEGGKVIPISGADKKDDGGGGDAE